MVAKNPLMTLALTCLRMELVDNEAANKQHLATILQAEESEYDINYSILQLKLNHILPNFFFLWLFLATLSATFGRGRVRNLSQHFLLQ